VISPMADDVANRLRSENSRLLVKPIQLTMKNWAADSFRFT
jgi:hypothetical protein